MGDYFIMQEKRELVRNLVRKWPDDLLAAVVAHPLFPGVVLSYIPRMKRGRLQDAGFPSHWDDLVKSMSLDAEDRIVLELLPEVASWEVIEGRHPSLSAGIAAFGARYGIAAPPASDLVPTPPPPPVWTPGYQVPAGGMAAWSKPDPALEPVARLAERVRFRLEETRGAWARVTGINGWTGWVDSRLLIPISDSPTNSSDPGPSS